MSKNTSYKYGLVGRDISYSFSKTYFSDKFKTEKLKHTYTNIDLKELDELIDFLAINIQTLKGLNVTIPYKESIIKHLDEVDETAQEIGAINCIKILTNNRLKGYNTDVFGFEQSLKPILKNHHKKALILGTGGASKAIAYALKQFQIEFVFVSRNPSKNQFSYNDLNKTIIVNHTLIINTTPLGTLGSKENQLPSIPYNYLTEKHLLYDLIYNPKETIFLKKGKEQGCVIKNGLEMLKLQADKSWEIWNSDYNN